ncbi:hypothetical protein PHLCEN_2v4416 [Hermanssonia centrifuga]|uniref:Protein-S-isoprenylcysteine O-methyltransferase n=1 Tax=Hermanssonia centrifuga TaxID=98765 RepID=A0A2R6PNL7_9APHY|nr:hypothetical protein PHLCEN_2v4416 [Hermanssonia centrifuga]
MDSPAILKAPLLLVAMYCCRICVKPPNPAASIEERTTFANRGNTRDVLGVIWPATLFRRTFYVIDLIELAVVLSSVLPFGKWTETFQASHIYISPSFILSLTMMCAGTVIRSAAYRHLGRYFTFELSIKKDHKLITDGPYSIILLAYAVILYELEFGWGHRGKSIV